VASHSRKTFGDEGLRILARLTSLEWFILVRYAFGFGAPVSMTPLDIAAFQV